MTWFKVDDGFAFHPKAGAAGNAALGLWVRAGSWCAQQLTDGEIPQEFLRVLGGKPRDAKALVDVGLWDATDKGWRFHDWSRFQPSKDQVLSERRSNAARQQVARSPELRSAIRDRDGDFCRYCGREVRWTDRRGALGGTYDHVIPDGPSDYDNLVVCCRSCNASKGRRTPEQAGMVLIQVGPNSEPKSEVNTDLGSSRPPTRPDPTRSSSGTTRGGAKRATQLPADWKPNDSHLEIAKEYGLDPAYELRAFRDRNEAKGSTYKNWDAAFRTWLNQAKTFRGGQAKVGTSGQRRHVPLTVPDHIDPDDTEAYAAWLREESQ